ncbi:MAG: LamG domain-containing protein, partial [bacterium]|nr:LamG domain-containing protein [bacterium]
MLLAGFLLFAPPAHASELTKPSNNLGLVGYWAMNDGTGTKAGDSSGNGNTGTWSGTGSHWTDGKHGQAGNFNGSDDYVNAGNAASLNITDAITISAWVKTNMTNEGYILNKFDNSQGTGGYAIAVGRASAGDFGYAVGGGADYFHSSGKKINDNIFHHVAVTHIGTVITFYVDGVFIKTATHAVPASWSGNLGIGYSPKTGIYFFNGLIDDVRVYNRALSADEVAALYRTGSVKFRVPDKTGLVGYWSFNDGNGTQAGDSSGNGNTGTLSGATIPTWVDGKRGKALSFDGSTSY